MMTSYPREKARHHHHNSTTKKQQKEKGKQLYRKDKICPPPSNIFTVSSMLCRRTEMDSLGKQHEKKHFATIRTLKEMKREKRKLLPCTPL